MSRKLSTFLVITTTAFNVAILAMNLSLPSRASVASMDSNALAADADFKKAVQSVVESCTVNVDIAKVRC
jgi:hypothetical protein